MSSEKQCEQFHSVYNAAACLKLSKHWMFLRFIHVTVAAAFVSSLILYLKLQVFGLWLRKCLVSVAGGSHAGTSLWTHMSIQQKMCLDTWVISPYLFCWISIQPTVCTKSVLEKFMRSLGNHLHSPVEWGGWCFLCYTICLYMRLWS